MGLAFIVATILLSADVLDLLAEHGSCPTREIPMLLNSWRIYRQQADVPRQQKKHLLHCRNSLCAAVLKVMEYP